MLKVKLLLFELLLFLFSPLLCLIVCVRFYRNPVSQFMFVMVAFYFGFSYPFDSDLYLHYSELDFYYYGQSFTDIISNPKVYYKGSEIYHILLKFVISRFTDSPAFFGGCACAIYAAFFVFFFRQLEPYYKRKQNILNMALLLVVVLTVEFRWFQGVRYWPGVFVFMAFYMKYINSRRWFYLLGCILAPFFHISLLALLATLALDFGLKYAGRFVRIGLFAISLFVRSLNVDFVPFLLKLDFLRGYLKLALINQDIRANDLAKAEEYRELHNFYYAIRPYLGIMIGLFILIAFYLKKATTNPVHMKVFTLALTMFTIANFGYGDIIFYDRFTKVATLLFFVYLYLVSVDQWVRLRSIRLPIAIMASVVAFYFALTVMVELRAHLYDPELVFGNMFIKGIDSFKDWGQHR